MTPSVATPAQLHAIPAIRPSRFAGRTIHFIGIGGCGMSGLARLLSELGAACSGSDSAPSDFTEMLMHRAVVVGFGADAAHLPQGCDCVIASAAIKPDHPEMLAAQERGLAIMTYAEALGQVQAERFGISIAGTHGKSTTVSMLCHVLLRCGLDPSFIVGATCPQIGGNSRVGALRIPGDGHMAGLPGVLVAEACEFNRSFHHHRPVLGVINNVEEDHLDIYGSLDAIIEAFHQFAQLLPEEGEGGWLLINHDGAHRREVAAGLRCAVETFGFNPAADWQIQYDADAAQVELAHGAERVARWRLNQPGEHNAQNAAVAAIVAHRVGGAWEIISAALSDFAGVERRMQKLGTRAISGGGGNGRASGGVSGGGTVTVYDDYGHHPTEIDATLRALRAAEKPKRLICVFQPHQHSRTRFLLDQFAQSFTSADIVIVPDIYFVRDSEIEKQRVSSNDLVERLQQRNIDARFLHPFDAVVQELEAICEDGDLVVIMGAGPIWKVAHSFMRAATQ